MKIIVDGMLGNIAKWLRLLGFDVFYEPNIDDDYLLKLTKELQGVLVTRDEQLSYKAIRNDVEVILIKKERKIETIKQILNILNVKTDQLEIGSRCIECNNKLIFVDKKELQEKLPRRIIENNDEFWMCSNCKKIYWHGSHWKNIESELKEILK
jgi:Uncharacterized conserved protein